MKKKILLIDDDLDICYLLSRFLTRNGYEVDMAHTGNKGIAKFKEETFDIVICDYRLGDKEGKDVLQEVRTINPDVIFLIITGYSDIKTAVEVIKNGAYDYITKPLIPEEVLNVLQSAIDSPGRSETPGTAAATPIKGTRRSPQSNGEYMIGEADSTRELYRQIDIVAPTDYSIILYGESGTGKEVIAQAIHNRSNRKDKPFVAVDCGTLSKELSGSELFGHMKGAFTGALSDKEGHFELANGGTLFLDEVANLSYEIQASLLRVIQERKFKRVGGTKEMPLDIRILVASNENLQEAYRKGKFREDLYHRFNEFSINLPPLRNRKQDIPMFAEFFLNKTKTELGKDVEGFDDEVMDMFVNYAWPGNLREFRNVVRRAVLLTTGGRINAKTLPWDITGGGAFTERQEVAATESAIPAAPAEKKELSLKDATTRSEYEAIMAVLKEVNFNKTKAAEKLKIDRKTLYNKIKSFEESMK